MKFTNFTIFIVFALVFGGCVTAPKIPPFSVDLLSPHQKIGTAEAYFNKYLSMEGLRKGDMVVSYYPVEDTVCLQFDIQYAEYNQFWDKTGRQAFIGALERYKLDYEQQLLAKASKRTAQKMYGIIDGFLAWKRSSVGAQAYGSPKLELGFNINERAAFFTTTQLKSLYVDPVSKSKDQISPDIMMYFTRAQAETLAALFDEKTLQPLRPQQVSAPVVPVAPVAPPPSSSPSIVTPAEEPTGE
ncbi:MAG: hypothetical protein LBI06_07725 [Treponema sp.]|jgi:hypothetical protein|nr:hypothetical protein [Treponema sp.]